MPPLDGGASMPSRDPQSGGSPIWSCVARAWVRDGLAIR